MFLSRMTVGGRKIKAQLVAFFASGGRLGAMGFRKKKKVLDSNFNV